MEKLLRIFIVLMVAFETSFAQSPYIRSNTVGTVSKPVTSDKLYGPVAYRELQDAVGESFIFLPQSKALQKFGYSSIYRGSNGKITYEEAVGKIIKLEKIENSYAFFKDENGQDYKAMISIGSIRGLAPIADIDSARSLFLNKVLWLKQNTIATYNEETESFGSVDKLKIEPVTVVDIVAGWYDNSPVRFILKSSKGGEGFIDINISGTNTSTILRDLNTFDEAFWKSDPRKLYPYSEEIWGLIKESKVRIGMTKAQAILSWGDPNDINKTTSASGTSEQWVYGKSDRSYLYFDGDKLTSIN